VAHKKYSLTCADYEALWERSGQRCEACGVAPDFTMRGRGLVIDHDHRYGDSAVRGLICQWCNTALGQLENPDIHPAFGRGGPGNWFQGYFQRAWFMRAERQPHLADIPIDRSQFRKELRAWRTYNKALFSTNPKTALVPLDKPSVIAQILREEMSPQAFAALVRALVPKSTALYRLYDGNNQLLYIGISADPEQRWEGHALYNSQWWPLVAKKAIEWHDDRHLALAHEYLSIAREKPLHNRRQSKPSTDGWQNREAARLVEEGP
jgi:hypothetical protein